MNRFFLLFSLVGITAMTASAGQVTFNTTGSQLCVGANGCAATQWIGSNVTISYLAAANNTVSAPSFSNLGSLQVTCNGGGTACNIDTLPANLTLYINVNQSVPTAGAGSIPGGLLSGTISGNGSLASINWTNGASTTIGFTTYSVTNAPLNLVPPTTNNGVTTIQAFVNTPEPGSIMLLSSGLAGLFLARRRRAV